MRSHSTTFEESHWPKQGLNNATVRHWGNHQKLIMSTCKKTNPNGGIIKRNVLCALKTFKFIQQLVCNSGSNCWPAPVEAVCIMPIRCTSCSNHKLLVNSGLQGWRNRHCRVFQPTNHPTEKRPLPDPIQSSSPGLLHHIQSWSHWVQLPPAGALQGHL